MSIIVKCAKLCVFHFSDNAIDYYHNFLRELLLQCCHCFYKMLKNRFLFSEVDYTYIIINSGRGMLLKLEKLQKKYNI